MTTEMSRPEALPAKSTDEQPPPSSPAQPTPSQHRIESITNLLTTYVAPATAIGGLIFYFGWTRARAFWLQFGIDPTVLGLSNQDYIVRSVNALFPALLFMAILAAAAPPIVRFTDRALLQREPKSIQRTRAAVALCGGAGFLLGVLALFRGEVFIEVVSPLLLGLGTLLIGWSRHLRRVFAAGSHRSLPETFAFWALITLSAFWAVSDFAQASGRGAARLTGNNLQARPAVTIHSVESLGLEGPGVTATTEPASERYRHSYSGLRVLLRTGGRYLLLPEQWKPGDPVFLIDESSGLRFEFSLPRSQ